MKVLAPGCARLMGSLVPPLPQAEITQIVHHTVAGPWSLPLSVYWLNLSKEKLIDDICIQIHIVEIRLKQMTVMA